MPPLTTTHNTHPLIQADALFLCECLCTLANQREEHRVILCREFLAYKPEQYYSTLPEIETKGRPFVDLLISMATHSDLALRYQFLELFLAQYPRFVLLPPPLGNTVVDVIERLGANLLNFTLQCEQAARKDVRLFFF